MGNSNLNRKKFISTGVLATSAVALGGMGIAQGCTPKTDDNKMAV